MSLVAAVEGPSDSGKSTLIDGLMRNFANDRPLLFPCYVDEAGGDDQVPKFTTDAYEQIKAIDFFLKIEADRYQHLAEVEDATELVLLDRSAFTLLAHSYAVERMHGNGIYASARERVTTAAEVIIPEIVLYLDADVEERRKRADPGDLDKWFTNVQFNEAIRGFFLNHFPGCGSAVDLHVLDANQPRDRVLEEAIGIISSSLR